MSGYISTPVIAAERARGGRGQTTVEFVVIMGILLAATAMLTLFLGTFRAYGDRVIATVASDYP